MDVRENARTTRHSRMLMVQRLANGWSVAAVAAAEGVSPGTVGKWRDRHAAHGEAGLVERSSRSHRSPARLAVEAEGEIEALRRQRLSGPAIASPAIAADKAATAASAGSICTSPSMMRAGSPTPGCCQTSAAHGLRHIRARPYTPQTNGKAERFIQTSLHEWAYAPRPSTPQPSVPPPCQPGSATTTVSGPIPLSAESRPSLTECGVECCRGLYAVGLSLSPPRRIVIPMDRQGY